MIVAAQRQQERNKKPELPSSTSDSTPSSTVPDADTQEKPSSSTCSTPQPLEGKEIVIEAKTFCKLGHFNLLLENFPKGTIKYYSKAECETNQKTLQPCPPIKNITIWDPTTGRMRRFCTAWDSFTSTSTRSSGEYHFWFLRRKVKF